jgi:hypothetical protein
MSHPHSTTITKAEMAVATMKAMVYMTSIVVKDRLTEAQLAERRRLLDEPAPQ